MVTDGRFWRRFWSRVEREGDGCWEWQGGRFRAQYGRHVSSGPLSQAHRASWIFFNGPIPSGLFVCHRCDNPPCCNPDHLFLGTHQDNMVDCLRKGRANKRPARGAKNGRAKLTETQVREIRRLSAGGTRNCEIAPMFGISQKTVWGVVNRQTWSYVA